MRPVGKRRTREHIIADQSICFVEWQALRHGCTVERVRHDYGIDLELKTYNADGEREPGDILMQVKATDGLGLRKGQKWFPYRVQRSDLISWLAEQVPVILVVFDAANVRAYWCYVQQYFQRRVTFSLFLAGKTVTVRVSTQDRLGKSAIRKFARYRDRLRTQAGELFHE
jgi:hypothetical protein